MPKMSWRLLLRIIAVIACIVSIAWFIHKPGFGPLVSFLSGVLALIGSFVVSDAPISITSEKAKSAREVRNRHAMLKRVNDFWVKSVLEQSLHGAVLIALGIEEQKDAVESPWDKVLQTPDQSDFLLPPDTKIVDVFDQKGQNLLILGEPGSGKTTMLLELARDTIARAEKDSNEPIPVVFNLSSWTDSKQSIAEWLVEELNTEYRIPKTIALSWIENDMLLLLLDGLDEVALERREKCVEAINEFRQEHLVPLVVCSRVADYNALAIQLKLQSAVLLQPLTSQQVNDYLYRAGPEFAAVHEALKKDLSLQELAQSPLMLSIMTLAYRGISVEDLQPLGTTGDRHKQHKRCPSTHSLCS
jgi:energy-coupling factor transporter ATP-binding protein EcfA2